MFAYATQLVLLTLPVLGQAPDEKLTYPPLESSYAYFYKLTETYDRFKDSSRLRLDLGVVFDDKSHELTLKILRTSEGKMRTKGRVSLYFLSDSTDGWIYLNYHPITLLVDGDRWKFNPGHDGVIEEGHLIEHMFVSLDEQRFLKLVQARKIEIQIGHHEFPFFRSEREALKDFAYYIANPGAPIRDPSQPPKPEIATPPTNQRYIRKDVLGKAYPCGVAKSVAVYSAVEDALDDGDRMDQILQGLGATSEWVSVSAYSSVRLMQRIERPNSKTAPRLIKIEVLNGSKKGIIGWCPDSYLVTPPGAPLEPWELEDSKRLLGDKKRVEAKANQEKIAGKLAIAQALEQSNPKGAVPYYKEILKLASPESPESKKAAARIKALEPNAK